MVSALPISFSVSLVSLPIIKIVTGSSGESIGIRISSTSEVVKELIFVFTELI